MSTCLLLKQDGFRIAPLLGFYMAGCDKRQTGCIALNSLRPQSTLIAVVDDDEPLREALASILKASGFAVRIFASAEEFLDSLDWRSVNCLILDVRLPGMSGVELHRYIAGVSRALPIIFVTAHGDDELQDLLLEAGASAFLNKPVRSDRLLNEIDAALAKPRNR